MSDIRRRGCEFKRYDGNSDNSDPLYRQGAKDMLADVIDELKIAVGAIILDGYDEYDSCVKMLNEWIDDFKNKHVDIGMQK